MDTNIIYNNDCIEILKSLPDESIDLTITSPPYNLGNKHHTGDKRHNPYPDNLNESEYQTRQINVLNEIYRITKSDGSILYNHKNRIKNGIQITPYEWLLKTKWTIKQEIIWFNGSQNFDKIRFYPMSERIYWLAKNSNTKLINNINHHDLFKKDEWNSVGINNEHTRAFPLQMIIDLLKCFPNANIILDPYCGSGTTLLGALMSKREYIGIEIDEKYYKLSLDRIDDYIDQSIFGRQK